MEMITVKQGAMRLLLGALSVMAVMTVSAKPVSKKAAQLTANRFMQQQLNTHGARRAPQMVDVGNVQNGQENEYLYLFNASDGQGFVIVSGDDRTAPILGYSTCGSIDMDQMPCNLRSWLKHYADQIALIQQYDLPASEQAIADCGEPLSPALTCKWAQDPIYNDQCPMVAIYTDEACTQRYEYTDQHGNKSTAPVRAVTGCAATALAQVLYQHQYPMATTAEIPAQDKVTSDMTADGVPIWQKYTDEAIPAGTVIDWDNMVDAYFAYLKEDGEIVMVTTTEEQNNAVASLMHICGVAESMSYGTVYGNGSGISLFAPVIAAANYLGLPNAMLCMQSLYDYQDWVQTLYDEIKVAQCTYFGGTGTGGHGFVVDGYDKEDFFHINWGWYGQFNGYFRINDLTPPNHNYSHGQFFGRGLYPGAPAVEKTLHTAQFDSKSTSVTAHEGIFNIPQVSIYAINLSHPQLIADLGLTIEGQAGKSTTSLTGGFADFSLGVPFSRSDTTINVGALTDGEYLCYLSFRTSENGEWMPTAEKETCGIRLTVSGDHMSIHNVNPISLILLSSDNKSTYQAGEPIQFTANLKNEGRFLNEDVKCYLTSVDEQGQWADESEDILIGRQTVICNSGGTFDITYSIPAMSAGRYVIFFTCSYGYIFQVCVIEVLDNSVGISLTPSSSTKGEGNIYYSLDGRKLSGKPNTKGLYIHNVRKVVIK